MSAVPLHPALYPWPARIAPRELHAPPPPMHAREACARIADAIAQQYRADTDAHGAVHSDSRHAARVAEDLARRIREWDLEL